MNRTTTRLLFVLRCRNGCPDEPMVASAVEAHTAGDAHEASTGHVVGYISTL